MSRRDLYLAKYRHSANQRTHFAIFIPNVPTEGRELTAEIKQSSCKGTLINVVGEPLLSGYVLEIRRNYECKGEKDLRELVFLGLTDEAHIYTPDHDKSIPSDTPRGTIEREATKIEPPRKGQDIRAPIDGVKTRRCQEWTIDFLQRLINLELLEPRALGTAQENRDLPSHGIFGQN